MDWNVVLALVSLASLAFSVILIVKFWRACNDIARLANKFAPKPVEQYLWNKGGSGSKWW